MVHTPKSKGDAMLVLFSLLNAFKHLRETFNTSLTNYSLWTDEWEGTCDECKMEMYKYAEEFEKEYANQIEYEKWEGRMWDDKSHYFDIDNIDSNMSSQSDNLGEYVDKINNFIESIDYYDCVGHIIYLLKIIGDYYNWMGLQIKLIRYEIEYEDIPWDLENLFCDIDEKGVIDSFTKSIHYLERRKYDECESDYERKKKENMFSVVSKTPLDILTEMQDEVKTRIIEDNAFKNILIEFMDEDGSINIFNMFRNLYMRSNSEQFLEDCIRYKWCQDKIAELNKEDEKASLESHEPGPVHETEEEMETMVQGSNDDVPEETIAAVMACFRQNGNENIDKREEALKFIRQVKERTPKEVGVLIGELVEQKLLSDVECHKKLWKPLHDAGFYKESKTIWNRHIKNNL